MAKIQFYDANVDSGDMRVSALFSDGDRLVEFGDVGLSEVMARIGDEHCQMQIKAIYNDLDNSGLGNFDITFEVDETEEMQWVGKLKVVLDGRTFEFGGYREFAEHNGVLGLRYSCRTRSLWIEVDSAEVA